MEVGEGAELRAIARRSGADRKTVRRYVEAAVAAGLVRGGDLTVDDQVLAAVVAAVKPGGSTGWAIRGRRAGSVTMGTKDAGGAVTLGRS